MRLLPTVALLAFAPFAAAGDAPPATPPAQPPAAATPAPAVDPALAAAMADLAASADAVGLPDIAGCEPLSGSVTLKRGDGDKLETEQYHGIHLKRADGTILVNGLRLPADGVTVEAKNLRPLPVRKRDEMNAEQRKGAEEWLKHTLHPDDQGQIADLIDGMMKLTSSKLTRLVNNESGILMLARFRDPEAAQLLRFATVSGMMGGAMEETAEPPLNVDPMASMRAWRGPRGMMGGRVEDPAKRPRLAEAAATLRRIGADSLLGIAIAEDPAGWLKPLDRAKVLAEAERLAGASPTAKARIASLRAALAVPATAPEKADLATRLASWGSELNQGRNFQPRRRNDDKPPEIPGADDPGALVALLGDERPSRWIDGNRGRSIGDNALRALTAVLDCDPRLVVGRDPAAPWTAAERTATAAAIAAWWKGLAGKPVDEIRLTLIEKLPPERVVSLLQKAESGQRGPVLDRLAAAWQKPPAGLDGHELAQILQLSDGHAGLRAAALAWPVEGGAAMALALLHAQKGDRSHLDQRLDKALAATGPAEGMDSWEVLPVVRAAGNAAQVRKLMAILAGEVADDKAARRWYSAFQSLQWGGNLAEQILAPGGKDKTVAVRGAAVGLACIAAVLADERALPANMLQQAEQHLRMVGFNGDDEKKAERKTATDLRFCDLATGGVEMLLMQAHEALDLEPSEIFKDRKRWRADPTADKAARDRVIADLRALLADKLPPLLKEAGLDLPVPGAGAGPKGDDKALF